MWDDGGKALGLATRARVYGDSVVSNAGNKTETTSDVKMTMTYPSLSRCSALRISTSRFTRHAHEN